MKKYTLEDVEFIRTRAYVTYDEAIGLLDAYEGDVVRVMAELERSGKLKNSKSGDCTPWETIKGLFRKGYEHRMVIRKQSKDVCNFSVIFWIIVLVFAPYITIPALVIALLLGYRISFRHEEGSAKEFNNIAYTAKENIRKAASTIRDEFNGAQQGAEQGTAQADGPTQPQEQETAQSNPHPNAAQPTNANANAQPNPAQSSSVNSQNSDIIIE